MLLLMFATSVFCLMFSLCIQPASSMEPISKRLKIVEEVRSYSTQLKILSKTYLLKRRCNPTRIPFDINTECSQSQLCSCQCFQCSCFKLLSYSKHAYLLSNQSRSRGSDIKVVLFLASMWKNSTLSYSVFVLPNLTPVPTRLPIMYELLYNGCIGVMEVFILS